MNCHSCQTDIQNRNWKYCPACGTTTAQLRLPELNPILVAGGQKGTATIIPIEVENLGFQPVGFVTTLSGAPDWVEIRYSSPVSPDSVVELYPRKPFGIELEVKAPTSDVVTREFWVVVNSNDGNRQPKEPWKSLNFREQKIKVTLLVQAPGTLELSAQIAIFSDKVQEREVELLNRNSTPISLSDLKTLPHLELLIQNNGKWVPLTDLLPGSIVPAASDAGPKRVTCKLRVKDGEYPLLLNYLNTSDAPEITFCDERGEGPALRIHGITDVTGGEIAPYIVSIDFGTDHSAVYGRNPAVPNSLEPIPIFGAGENTFFQAPSYIAYHQDDPYNPVFGRQAKEYARQPYAFEEWQVFSDVKLWLRSTDPAQRDQYNRVLVDLLSQLRRDINGHLIGIPEFNGRIPNGVKYVITLPVLDNDVRYEEQKKRMLDALCKAFAREIRSHLLNVTDFEFVKEPQAAAACFLLGQEYLKSVMPDFFLEPFKVNDLVVVVDSGAGTTDVALVLVTANSDANKFDVLSTFGTAMGTEKAEVKDKELKAFAGREVDKIVCNLACISYAKISENGAPTSEQINDAKNLLKVNLAEANELEEDPLDPERHLRDVEPEMMQGAEDIKIKLDDRPFWSMKETVYTKPEFSEIKNYVVKRPDLEDNIRPAVKAIIRKIEDLLHGPAVQARLETLPPEHRHLLPTHIFCVGGTSNMPVIENELQAYFDAEIIDKNRLLLPGDRRRLRMQAVVQGGAWSYRAPIGNLAPYGLGRIILNETDSNPKFFLQENVPFSNTFHDIPVHVRSHHPCLCQIFARVDGENLGLFMIELQEPGSYVIKLELKPDWILEAAVIASSNQSVTSRFKYNLK